jgi:hypothetical protein
MKARPSTTNNSSSRHDARIDAVLQTFTHAEPSPGLESRVVARLYDARLRPHFQFRFAGVSGLVIVRRISAGALAAAAGAAIVVGTIHHSERPMPPQAFRPGQSGGLTPAGAVHVPTHALPKSAIIDPAFPRAAPHGRATVSRNQAHRGAGAAVPRSPYPPDQQPDSSANPQQ